MAFWARSATGTVVGASPRRTPLQVAGIAVRALLASVRRISEPETQSRPDSRSRERVDVCEGRAAVGQRDPIRVTG